MFRSIHDRDRQRPRPPFERQSELLLDRRGQRNGKRVGAVHVEPRWRPPARGLEFNQGVEEPVEPGPVDHRCLELAGKPADEFRERASAQRCQSYYEARIPFGPFQAEIAIPFDIEWDETTADYQNGLLTVSLPRRRARSVEVRDVGQPVEDESENEA